MRRASAATQGSSETGNLGIGRGDLQGETGTVQLVTEDCFIMIESMCMKPSSPVNVENENGSKTSLEIRESGKLLKIKGPPIKHRGVTNLPEKE